MKLSRVKAYERAARAAADAAMSGKHPPELTAYYARLALWLDDRARKARAA